MYVSYQCVLSAYTESQEMDSPIERPRMDKTEVKVSDKDFNEILRSFELTNNELRPQTHSL